MRLTTERLVNSFNTYFEAKGYYTFQADAPWDAPGKNLDAMAMSAGAWVMKSVAKHALHSHAPIPLPKFASANEAPKAYAQLLGIRDRFAFVGFKIQSSMPIVVLGLMADDLSPDALRLLITTLPYDFEFLREYGMRTKGAASGGVMMKLLLIYHRSTICTSHRSLFINEGNRVNQPIGVSLRTCFVDITQCHLQWSQLRGLGGKIQALCWQMGAKMDFEQDDLSSLLKEGS